MIFLTKYISLLLQIILVAVAVILFCWFDPFDIVKMRRLRMQQTATMVDNIKAIGQLYSAEYYGEVIKSSNQKLVDSITIRFDTAKSAILHMEKSIIDELKRIYTAQNGKDLSAGDLYKLKMKDFFGKVKAKKLEKVYDETMDALLQTERVRKELPWILTRPRISVMNFLYEQNKIKSPPHSYLSPVALENVVEDEYGFTRKEAKIQERNQLVILARGWVKAGIDFSHFDEDHLKYLEGRNRILLIRHKPKILSKTINPWFIPKESIEGFQYLVIGENYQKYTDERSMLLKVQQLKSECLDDLEQQAIQADLLGIAQKNAEETLSKFFSLLLEKDVTVEIFGHPLEAYRTEFAGTNNELNPLEAKSIDSLISIFADTAFYQAYRFAADLKKLDPKKIHSDLKNADWNAISLFYTMSKDSIYSAAEQNKLDVIEQAGQPTDYFYFMVFNQPDKLESLLRDGSYLSLKKVRDLVDRDSTATIAFAEYRKAKFQTLRKALQSVNIQITRGKEIAVK
jgi:hypothetical protein